MLKLGIGGAESLDLGEVFCCATANEASKPMSEQKNKNEERRMTSFLKPDSCSAVAHSHTPVLAAIGKRRPEPKAFGEIFNPGAACWRLYSARSTIRITFCTSARS